MPIDYDGDGDLDLAFISLQTLRLLENRMAPEGNHFARVRLEATKTQKHALGAQVVLRAGGVEQRDYVKLVAGFQTQVPLELHFGLADAERIERITISWPSGAAETFEDLPADRVLSFVEGHADPEITAVPAWPETSRPKARAPFALDASAQMLDGGRAPLAEPGRPVLVNFWAPWCKPCNEELPLLARLARSRGDEVRFVGVSVEMDELDDVRAAIARLRLPYPQFVADDALMASFFGEDGTANLPSTFVFDGEGKLSRAFHRAVGQAEIEAALDALREIPGGALLMLPLGEEHLLRGEIEEAKAYFKKGLAAAPGSPALLAQYGAALSLEGKHDEAIRTLTRAIRADPEFPYGLYLLGAAYKRAGRFEESIAALEKAVALQPEVPRYWMTLGASYSHTGALDKALAAFDRVVALDPTSVAGWLNVGKARVLGKQPGAAEAFRRVLVLDPENRDALGLLERYGGP